MVDAENLSHVLRDWPWSGRATKTDHTWQVLSFRANGRGNLGSTWR